MPLVVKNLAADAGVAGEAGSIPGLGRSSGGGNGNPLQYSCLENPIDRGAWWPTVHRVVKSWTWLKWLRKYAVTFAKALIPNKVTFTGPGNQNLNVYLRESQLNPLSGQRDRSREIRWRTDDEDQSGNSTVMKKINFQIPSEGRANGFLTNWLGRWWRRIKDDGMYPPKFIWWNPNVKNNSKWY